MRSGRIALALLGLVTIAVAIGGHHDDIAVSAAAPPAPAPTPPPAEKPKTPEDVFLESLAADRNLASGFYDNGVCEAYVRENRADLIPFPGGEKTICTITKALDATRSTRSPRGPNWVEPPHND